MNMIIDGIRYNVEISGEGFPFLLLHGFTGDASTWFPFAPLWGKRSKLIIPDIIGHGKTATPEDLVRYKIESAAHDLKGILDELKIEKVDILGYSMGGRLALTFTLLFPERVRKLILESASPGLLTESEREPRRLKDAELAQFIKDKGIERFVDYWENIPLFETMKRLPENITAEIRKQRLTNSPTGLSNSLLGMGTGSQPSWWESLDRINHEVLLVTGELDEKFCGIAKNMIKNLKNGKWIVVENSGHANHVEDSEKFGTIVSDFINKP